jgi:predicted enzyme involved in methoxymalonyl-ACP biosynthesis
MLLMMEEQLLENPGQLLPMQISDDDEWYFYSEFSEFEDSEMAPWKRNAYSVIISNIRDHIVILQASLPGIEFAGIDIFEDGKHFADYMYNTVEEFLEDLSNITWIYFRPKDKWNKDQIIRYTENWYGKSVYDVEGPDLKFHTEYSYVHHPEIINLTSLHAVFKLIQATVLKEYDTSGFITSLIDNLGP